jgi:hypothetical protein
MNCPECGSSRVQSFGKRYVFYAVAFIAISLVAITSFLSFTTE